MTTLQEDILKAQNQGRPGYDVLGSAIYSPSMAIAHSTPATIAPMANFSNAPIIPQSVTAPVVEKTPSVVYGPTYNGPISNNPVVAPTVQTPVTQTPAGLGISTYIQNETADEKALRLAQEAESARLAGLAAPESEADRRTRITNQFQGEIDALNAVYANQKQEAISRGMGRLGTDAAIQARRGLVGSTFGTGQTEGIQSANAQDINAVEVARGQALSAVYSKIQAAITGAQKDKEAAQKLSTEDYMATLKGKLEKSQKTADDIIKGLIASKANVTNEELDKISSQLVQLGIDPSRFKQQYISAAQEEVKRLQLELATQKKAKQDAEKVALDMLKTNVDITKPYESGGYVWQYNGKTGNVEKLGDARSITKTGDDSDTFGEITAADKAKGLNWLLAQPDVTQEDIDMFKSDRKAQAIILNAMNAE